MLVSLAILAYAASMMTHEALGHGADCLAAGGHTVMLTVWMEHCTVSGGRAMKAAGPGVQFAAGLLAWLILRCLPARAARLRYFVWLFMTFSLLIASSYVAFSGITMLGDGAEFIVGLHPLLAWRAGLVLCGSVLYFLSLQATAMEINRFCGRDIESRRIFRLIWIPYVAAGCFACCSALPNKTMLPGAALGYAAASSFGSGSGLFALVGMQHGAAASERLPTVYLRWNALWSIAAALVILAFLLFLGPGLK